MGKFWKKCIFPIFISKWANYSPILRGKNVKNTKKSHDFSQCGYITLYMFRIFIGKYKIPRFREKSTFTLEIHKENHELYVYFTIKIVHA